ncbi:MAG: helix-turn-helix domain-containing protein [Chloroflexota bacterium]|nr:helix-turn-helix domain-containing protein [Chloroflexota bacterium]
MATTKTLRAWRAEQLLSTRRLATVSGTSNKTIVQIENGRQTPTFATIEKISRVLQLEPREVHEFALALAERARPSNGDHDTQSLEPVADTGGPPATHVLCVSAVASFLTVTRRLLEAERYGVTTMIGVPVTVEQVARLQPEVVVLDLGTHAPCLLGLMQCLQRNEMTARIPIVVTGRDRRRLGEHVAGLDDAAGQRVTVAPFDRDLRELVAAVESLTRSNELAVAI